MSILGKMKFWKKDDAFESDLGPASDSLASNPIPNDPLNHDLPDDTMHEMPSDPNPAFSSPHTAPIEPPQGYTPHNPISAHSSSGGDMQMNVDKDFLIIQSKLDTLKAQLDLVNQRLIKIEKIAEKSEQEQVQPQAPRYKW